MTYHIERLSSELGFSKIVRGLRSSDISRESVRIALRGTIALNDWRTLSCLT
jgi:hypothetical protein